MYLKKGSALNEQNYWSSPPHQPLQPLIHQSPEVLAELDHTLGGGGFVDWKSLRDNNGSNVREAKAEGSVQADRGLSPWRPGLRLCC